tara:strand:- start:3427 stop:3792 length:366 start_codon:yes stop_codon:yes gene_type:complete
MRGAILATTIAILTVPSFMVNAGVQISRAYGALQDQRALFAYEQTDLASHAELFGDYARDSLGFLATPDAFFPGTSFYKAPAAPVFGPMMGCIVDNALNGGESIDCHVKPAEESPLELAAL